MPIAPDHCSSELSGRAFEATPARRALLGALEIRRALPIRERRLVGPWCFLDRYGPLSFAEGLPMDLAAHPHIGLQTVSWLLEGEILHRDSLGSEVLLRAGGLNLMTAGAGIAHSENTPRRNSGRLSGIQLWIALPDASRGGEARFDHLPEVPALESAGGRITVFLGELAGMRSPAPVCSPLVGAEIEVAASLTVPLDRRFEHALFVLEGEAMLEGEHLAPDVLYFLGTSRDEMTLAARGRARILLLGGTPFGEQILMWWNFVARTHEEILAAAEDWMAGRRFGKVAGSDGPPMPAPPLRGRARPPAAS